MSECAALPLTLALSPQAGRGDDLLCRALSIFTRLKGDGRCVYSLLPAGEKEEVLPCP